MFYSHEVLTSRKYGVATVWLVATLGTASERRKVKRSEIEGVDVTKACETITSTETPLALRLQSNLLFGVTRVYSQQCTFVLKDAETVRTQVRNAMTALRATTTTTSAGRLAKVGNITLEEDPNFALEIELIPGLDLDYPPVQHSEDPGIFRLQSQLSGSDSQIEPITELLQIPPSDDHSIGGAPFDLGPPRESSVLSGSGARLGSQLFHHGLQTGGLIDDPGFGFDAEGNFVEGTVEERAAIEAARETPSAVSRIGRADHFQQHSVPRQSPTDILNLPMDDDFNLFPNVEPLSIHGQSERGVLHSPGPPAEDPPGENEEEQDEEEGEQAVTATAPARAQRQRKVIAADTQMELRNAEYLQWERSYADNMGVANKSKVAGRVGHIARINAEHWVEANGVSDLNAGLSLPVELQAFAGLAIFEAFTRRHDSVASSKRSRSAASANNDEEDRRVRPRLSSEVGRADDVIPQLGSDHPILAPDDGLEIPQISEEEATVEVGRRGETPLADHPSSSRMPWNISASVRGSSAHRIQGPVFGSGARVSSSIGGGDERGRFDFGPSLARSSVAPSPLRQYALPSIEGGEDTFQLQLDDPTGIGGDQEQVAATAGGAQMSWLSGTTDHDMDEFYAHVVDAAANRDDVEGVAAQMTFEELFPPAQHTAEVAAKGFLHLLALNGRSALKVEQGQDTGFLPIFISVL